MRDIALPLQDFLGSLDADAATACYARKIQAAFAQAIYDVYGMAAVRLILSHVQAVYVMDEEGTFVGDARPLRLLRVYTSDPTVRADLDARQEFIKMSLAKQGIRVDKVKLHASTFGMKEREPFRKLLQRLSEGEAPFQDDSSEDGYRAAATLSMTKLLQMLKTALCQVFREDADVVVKAVNAAYVERCSKNGFAVDVYTDNDQIFTYLEDTSEACRARMRELGLIVVRYRVHLAEPWMVGQQAFPALSAPVVVERLS